MNQPWLLGASFLLGLALLGALVRAAIRTVRAARICAAPLRERQLVEFPVGGRVLLCIEGPRFTPQFRHLRYELSQPGGAAVPGRPVVLRAVASGRSGARMTLRSYTLPFGGRYQLDIQGLRPTDIDAPGHLVVFTRPHLHRVVLLVVGMVIAAGVAITSLVFLLLALVPAAGAIDPGRVSGFVQSGARRIALNEAYAQLHRHPAAEPRHRPELRILLADREVPQASLAGDDPLPLLELAHDGALRGVLLRLDPDDPDTLTLTLLLPSESSDAAILALGSPGRQARILRDLRLGPQRVSGSIECPREGDLQCSARFSAPVFND